MAPKPFVQSNKLLPQPEMLPRLRRARGGLCSAETRDVFLPDTSVPAGSSASPPLLRD